MHRSPGFSNFRDLMDMWDIELAEGEFNGKIKSLIDGRGLILFFKKGDDVFGCDEDSRVLFAKMKNPKDDEDLPKNWDDDASFMANNLSRAIRGESTQSIFSKKDLKEIKVIDKEEAEEALLELAKGLGDKAFPNGGATLKVLDLSRLFKRPDDDESPNFVRADEE
jgi:hypothetical protein